MLLDQIFSGDSNQMLEKKGYLKNTKNTVKFGDNAYQFGNVGELGIGQTKTKEISIVFMISFCFVVLFLSNNRLGTRFPSNKLLAGFFWSDKVQKSVDKYFEWLSWSYA